MKITIFVDGAFRNYDVEEDEIAHIDFNEVVEDMIDSVNKAKEI